MTFKFSDSTPALEAYLAHEEQPYCVYAKKPDGSDDYRNLTPDSQADRDAWKGAHSDLEAKVPQGLEDAYWHAKKVWQCRDETQQGLPQIFNLGPYVLEVTSHATSKGCWAYTRGRVFKGTRLIETIYRNYSGFPYAYIARHANGHSYLICGEDYQGQTVIELDTGKRVDHMPEAGKHGFGFCWVVVNPNPDGTLLAVEGCVWACPYQVQVIDFAEPLNAPWLILHTDDIENFTGWSDNSTCQISETFEAVDLPGHPLHGKKEEDLTIEEEGAVSDEFEKRDIEVSWGDVVESHTWSRPSNKGVVRKWVLEQVPFRLEQGGGYYPDDAVQFTLMWERLSANERDSMLAEEKVGGYCNYCIEWAKSPRAI